MPTVLSILHMTVVSGTVVFHYEGWPCALILVVCGLGASPC